MHTGHKISGAAHLALLGFMAFGDFFSAEPLPLQSVDVSLVSGAAFDAMLAGTEAPQSVTEVAQPAAPEVAPEVPEISARPQARPDLPQPEAAAEPEAETPPDVSQIVPLPRAEVSDQAPVLDQPEADVAVLVPEVADTPVPEAAERVAPEAVAQPDPEARPDPVEQEAVAPDAAGETPQEPAEATAPEAAATEIVTEAEKPARAPEESRRPPARRPEPPVRTATPAPEPRPEPAPAQETETTADAVNSALQEALAAPERAPTVASGPPLSAGEKEALRVAVSSCWNVGSLSTDALGTTVVVEVAMAQDGKPITGSIRMASFSGGTESAARQAFEAARRAIIRCGARGFDLPVEKYGQWQNIEMTFNPERMRVK